MHCGKHNIHQLSHYSLLDNQVPSRRMSFRFHPSKFVKLTCYCKIYLSNTIVGNLSKSLDFWMNLNLKKIKKPVCIQTNISYTRFRYELYSEKFLKIGTVAPVKFPLQMELACAHETSGPAEAFVAEEK